MSDVRTALQNPVSILQCTASFRLILQVIRNVLRRKLPATSTKTSLFISSLRGGQEFSALVKNVWLCYVIVTFLPRNGGKSSITRG